MEVGPLPTVYSWCSKSAGRPDPFCCVMGHREGLGSFSLGGGGSESSLTRQHTGPGVHRNGGSCIDLHLNGRQYLVAKATTLGDGAVTMEMDHLVEERVAWMPAWRGLPGPRSSQLHPLCPSEGGTLWLRAWETSVCTCIAGKLFLKLKSLGLEP